MTNKRGPIIAIGGHEDKYKEMDVLQKIVSLAGEKDARIGLITAASKDSPNDLKKIYKKVFKELGASEMIVLDVSSRDDASDHKMIADLKRSTLVFITGGDQLRLVEMLEDTPFLEELQKMNEKGIPIAGTSAGAGAIPSHMIAKGRSGQMVFQKMAKLTSGLSLMSGIVVDQHFSQRRRIGRLFTAVSCNPDLIGIGVDENTAAAIDADDLLTVWGAGSVTIIDGHDMIYSDVAKVEGGAGAAVLGLRVHVLTEGCSFDLDKRKPKKPA